ncbi:MAG: hypothetical protein ACE366_13745 [Bradymonadia bacterium]
MRFSLHALVLLSGLFFCNHSYGQAWVQPPGHAYMKVSYGSSTARDQYAFDGRRKPYADDVQGNAFFDRSMYFYGEFGLLPTLTLSATAAYKRTIVTDGSFRYESGAMGDSELGLRWSPSMVKRWLPSGGSASLNLKAGLPTGYARNITPAPGEGPASATLSLDYGQSLSGWGYTQVGLGYRVRTGWYGLSSAVPCEPGVDRTCVADERPDLGDEVVGRAELGVRPWPWLLVQGQGELVWSPEAPTVGFAVGQTQPVHRRWLRTNVGLLVEPVQHLGLSATVGGTIWGQNTVRSFDVFFGISTDFQLWSSGG